MMSKSLPMFLFLKYLAAKMTIHRKPTDISIYASPNWLTEKR